MIVTLTSFLKGIQLQVAIPYNNATTVDHCTKQSSCRNYSFKLFNCIANFTFDESTGSDGHQLATAGKKFKFSSNYTFPLLVIPGKTFELPIFLIDEFDH